MPEYEISVPENECISCGQELEGDEEGMCKQCIYDLTPVEEWIDTIEDELEDEL